MEIPTSLPDNADETLTAGERALTISCCVIVGLTTILRYLGRWCLKSRFSKSTRKQTEGVFGLDDVFNIFAVLTFYGLAIAVFIAIDRGMGVHVGVVLYLRGIDGLGSYSLAIYFCAIFYNSVLGFIKLSVLSLYQRLLKGINSNVLRLTVWIMFGIVACNTIANVTVAIFQCSPIKAAWDLTITDKKCIDANRFYLGNAITGVITDALVYSLSIPLILPLQMDTKTKIGIMATLLIGAFAVVTSAIRLAFIPSLLKDPDATMAMGVPMDWSVVEPMVGILVSSMPAIRAIRYLWNDDPINSYSGSNSHSHSHTHSHSNFKTGRSQGHIQLYDMNKDDRRVTASATANGGHRPRHFDDNDSEEHLVDGKAGIAKTTEVNFSYENKSHMGN